MTEVRGLKTRLFFVVENHKYIWGLWPIIIWLIFQGLLAVKPSAIRSTCFFPKKPLVVSGIAVDCVEVNIVVRGLPSIANLLDFLDKTGDNFTFLPQLPFFAV